VIGCSTLAIWAGLWAVLLEDCTEICLISEFRLRQSIVGLLLALLGC
jgi:hypothetical protein